MRYVLHDQAGAVVPQTVMDNKAMSEYTMGVAMAQDVYEKLLEMGVPKEDARFVLPIGTMTRLVITMNCRSLRHLFKVRISKHAQWEIRDVAKEMLRQCLEVAPNAFGDFEELLDV
jgi:thymidylate synthase (FAD)